MSLHITASNYRLSISQRMVESKDGETREKKDTVSVLLLFADTGNWSSATTCTYVVNGVFA